VQISTFKSKLPKGQKVPNRETKRHCEDDCPVRNKYITPMRSSANGGKLWADHARGLGTVKGAHGVEIISTPDTNPWDLRHNGSLPLEYNNNVNCQDLPDEYGVCSNCFFDGKDSCSLIDGQPDEKNHFALPESLLSNGWTTGEALFVGVKDCDVAS